MPDDSTCPECGATVPEPMTRDGAPQDRQFMTCVRCGTRNEPDAKFCKQCGDRLGSANA